MKRSPASPAMLQEWSTAIQFKFAECLPLVTSWTCHDAVFHGGTSLNMSWGSPRYSEDLDFLLSKEKAVDLDDVITKVLVRMRASMLLSHPGLDLELRNKSKAGSNLKHFQIVASHPQYLEKAMVKVEFWKVDAEYLKDYASEFVFPTRHGDFVTRSSSPLAAATLESAYADKLTAFATRPYLKWRDIFDLWWIDQQVVISQESLARKFLHNVSGYTTINEESPGRALRSFLARETIEHVIAKAETDLQRWLPGPVWTSLWPQGVEQMTRTAFRVIQNMADYLDPPIDKTGNELSSPPAKSKGIRS